jgi:glycosyltransferase involved in cell wall biosynthesis
VRVAYVTTYDAADVEKWSGLGVHIARTLQQAGCELTYVNALPPPRTARAFQRLVRQTRHRGYIVEREPHIAHLRARRIERSVPDPVDLIFSPGTTPIALLETATPIVFWTDATFGAMIDFYPSFTNLGPRTVRNGFTLEESALNRAAAAIYASNWAARSAVSFHGANPDRVHVLPFGANLDDLPTKDQVRSLIASRTRHTWRLIFIGDDWSRKRGEIAVETARLLNERNIKAELTVIGRAPQGLPPFVQNVGHLNKSVDANQFVDHLANSHFLLLPSRAECAGVVFSEASAFGIPSFGANVGGVASQLRDGVNGRLLPADAGPQAYADAIEAAIPHYDALANSSLEEYHTRLSWACSGKAIVELLGKLVPGGGRVLSTAGSIRAAR